MTERVQGITAEEIRRCVDEEDLRDWVKQQRWYASKARSVAGIELSVPARDYRLAAELLAQAVERGGSRVELEDAAQRAGAEAATGTDVMARLRSMGYDPVCVDGVVRLRNCPFHAVAEGHRGVVCDMNLSLLTGLAEAAAPGCFSAELRPEPGFCCVVLRSGGRSRVSP